MEALHTSAHLLNILPSAAIDNDIPATRLFKMVSNYQHLRTFGCLCYPNLLPTSMHKLAQRSTPCVFLGYPTDHRGYRCLDLHTRRIIPSHHVVFVETIFQFSQHYVKASAPLAPLGTSSYTNSSPNTTLTRSSSTCSNSSFTSSSYSKYSLHDY